MSIPDDRPPTNEEEIFQAAAALSGAERATYLRTACGSQPKLRERVERLLASHDDAAFMQRAADRTLLVAREGALAHQASEQCGDRIGHYKLLQQIGEGGCGIVYMAQQEAPVRRSVALKILKLGTDTKSVIARFQEERQALAMMDHPNIAKVFDAGSTHTGRPFFVMELVRGIKITEYCDQNHLCTTDRLDLFVQVCQAVQHAHQKGIIHRDIKPSNILVTLHDGAPVPKVIDFGIAKATTGQRLTDATLFTAFGQFIGTPAYMSPEQAEMSGLDIDTRSDIYSLGVLLYELLTGRTPFDGPQLMASGLDAMRKTIREKEPLRPSTSLTQELAAAGVRPRKTSEGLAIPSGAEITADSRRRLRLKEQITRLRGDLDWIVMKCLEKDRSRRYDTATGLAADLKRHLNNEPVIARPPSAAYKFQKAWRRNKLAFTAAAAVAIALVAGIGVSTWQALEAQRARDAAQTESEKARTEQAKAEIAQRQAEAEKINAQHDRYVANINLAGQAWEHDNFGRLRKVLEDTRAFPDRGFEWYYWQRQAHLNVQTLRGHLDHVKSVAYSPDGQRIVTASADRTALVWDSASGRELTKLVGHNDWVGSAGFSPDGLKILTASGDRTARVWEWKTGRELFQFPEHGGPVESAAYSPDGRWIVTGASGDERMARIWDATSHELLHRLEGHTGGIIWVAFSPDSKRVVTGSYDRTARVWDAASGGLLHILSGQESEVYSAVFSPDSQWIATGGIDMTARVWDVASGRELFQLEGRGTKTSMAFSPDGRRLVVGSWESAARLWDLTTHKVEQTFRGTVKGVSAVAYSPDGHRIVTAGGDATVKVWDTSTNRNPLRLQGNLTNVMAVAFSRDGKRIVTGTGSFGVDVSVGGSGDQAAQVWDAASAAKLLTLTGHSSGIGAVAFFPDGLRIVTGSGDRTAKVWDVASAGELLTLIGHTRSVGSVAVSPDGQRIATGSHDGTARVWDATTGRELFKLLGHTAPVSSVAFSPDRKLLMSGSHDAAVMVWEAASGQQVRKIKTTIERIYSVAFSPDSQRIAACGWGLGLIWELGTDREPIPLHSFGSPLSSLTFSPDGKRIVTGSLDGTARIWESTTGRDLLTLLGHRASISSVAFSPDGKRIVTGSHDRTALVWEAATEDQVAAWDEEERAADQARAASNK